MAEIVNQTVKKAAENASKTNSTLPTSAEPSQATGLLDQAIGPALEFWNALPIYGKVGLAGIAGAAFLAYKAWENRDKAEKLEATDWEEKFESLFKEPVEKAGRKDNTKLYNRTDVGGKRLMGQIVKLDSNQTSIADKKLVESIEDEEKWKEIQEQNKQSIKGVTYAFVEGDSKLSLVTGNILYRLFSVFSKGSNPMAEYLDLDSSEVEVTDQGVEILEETKLIKDDGLWQSTSQDSQSRLIQLTWLSTHQNWTESMQKQPEFYSDLNMNISGIKNIENTKSQNMKEYKKTERMQEKSEAMQD